MSHENIAKSNTAELEVINPDLAAFSEVAVTKVDDTKPWEPALEVTVGFPDGSSREQLDANTDVYAFALAGKEETLTVSIEAAGHVDSLHIKGTEPGSIFDYEDLTSLFGDMAERIPVDTFEDQNEVSAFSMEMDKHMGQEGIATMEELESDGIVTPEDIATAQILKAGVAELNLGGTEEDKQAFVDSYQAEHPEAVIQFQVVRGGAVVPMVNTPKRDTTELFVVFGPGDHGKTLYTVAPGRFMPKHPDPNQHRDEAGIIDEATFAESSDAWFKTVMLADK